MVKMSAILALGLLWGMSAWAEAPEEGAIAGESSAVTRVAWSPEQVQEEATRLRGILQAEVPQARFAESAEEDQAWVDRTKAVLGSRMPTSPQVVVVVDRNPHVQQLRLVVVDPTGPWYVVGGTRVSTGQAGRFDHYITPVGVFPHTDAILDYRAMGTFNDNHIRGIGLKGMRVWDFGWNPAIKGWTHKGEQINIRLQMHATDPVLEARLGHPASDGCVRVPTPMNVFMDHHGILDRDYETAAKTDARYRGLLPKARTPTPLAGDLMVVVDSAT